MATHGECIEKLCHVATALVVGSVAGSLNMQNTIGLVEAALGMTSFAATLGRDHAAQTEQVLKSMRTRVQSESETWIRARLDKWQGARAQRETALHAFYNVIPDIVPSSKELVAEGLDRDRIIELLRARAARTEKGKCFETKLENEVALEVFRDIASYTFDIVRHDQNIQTYINEELLAKLNALPDAVAERVVAMLKTDLVLKAHEGGLERTAILALARRLKPNDVLNFDQAVAELENAVAVALDVIARGERGSNLGEFVDGVLSSVAEQTKAGAFYKAASEVDSALAELDRCEDQHRAGILRARIALTESGIEQEILRRDAGAAARRIESLIGLQTEDRPVSWSPAFLEGLG